MSDYAWTRWLAVAVHADCLPFHIVAEDIADLARAEYVRGQVDMRERAVGEAAAMAAKHAAYAKAERGRLRTMPEERELACLQVEDEIRALEPEGGG